MKGVILLQNLFTEYLYSCKAQDEEGQDLSCTCMELKEEGKYNCTCFANDPPTTEVHYLNCLDALRKGQNSSGVYTIKPDNMSPFKVLHSDFSMYFISVSGF